MSTSPPLAQHFFYPVFRRGAAADIPATSTDGLSGDLPAARVAPAVALNVAVTGPSGFSQNSSSGPVDSNNNPTLFLYGPGDVVGFDTRHVLIPTEPSDGTPNFEPNYFAGIEFDDPDLLWLFTPAQATAQGQLRPWLVLVVLADGECTLTKAATSPGLDWITLSNNPQILPDLSESWAWAHAHLTCALGSDTLPDLVKNQPHRLASRLLCPRSLQPDTHYTAYLVPAFLAGAAKGLPAAVPTPATTTDQLGPAWNIGDAVVNLPVYHSFSFSTSDAGDFESLARRLSPQVLTGVGSRAMAVDDARNLAGWGVPPATSANETLDLRGALDSLPPPGVTPTDEWSAPDQAVFKLALAQVINASTPVTGNPADPDPVVVPPIYGRYHAAVTGVSATSGGWVNELNLDPRLRAPAGVGAQVVTTQRSALMTSAWRQIAGIELANRILRHAQMARAALQQTYQYTYSAISSVALLMLASNVLRRIGIGSGAAGATAWSTIASSSIPWRAFFPSFRRLVRPFGPIRTIQGQAGASNDGLITGLNDGSVSLLAPSGAGSGTIIFPIIVGGSTTSSGGTTSSTSGSGGPLAGVFGPVPSWLQPWARLAALLVLLVALIADLLILIAGAAGRWLPGAVVLALLVLVLAILIIWWLLGGTSSTPTTTPPGTNSQGYGTPQSGPGGTTIIETSASAPGLSGYQVVSAGTAIVSSTVTSGSDSGDATTFRNTLQGVISTLSGVTGPPTASGSIDLASLANSVLGALDPTNTVVRRALSFVNVNSRLQWAPADPIEPIMAAPDFPQPMYAPLCDLSQEFLLPGVGTIPRESTGLLQPNSAFIESYMVGLNFEMGRQLLWNGYPTDQRGSYFRQFWDVSGYVPGPTDPPLNSPQLIEELKDIAPINTWDPTTDIGTHPNPESPGSGAVLVLLIRGELLRRYPYTHVFAVPELFVPAGSANRIPNPDPSAEMHPLFSGTMAPDLNFYGFALSPTTAATYYFVLQQHPTGARFGLETDNSPGAWQNFPSGFATVASQTLPDGSASSLPANWGSDSANMANITFRQPVQVAIHGTLMLPAVGASS